MGLFSGKKTITVASTVYNMAGLEEDRPNFMKSTLFSAVMSRYPKYLGETIVQSYLSGPGIRQRALFNYAVRNDVAGLPTLSISRSLELDPAIVGPEIPIPSLPVGLELHIQGASIQDADYDIWAMEFMEENYSALVGTDWFSDYNSTTGVITIQFESGSTTTFTPVDFDKNARYLIADYYLVLPEEAGSVVNGSLTTGVISGVPSASGYTLTETENLGVVNYTLNQTVTVTETFSDGRTPVVTVTTPTTVVPFNTTRTKMEKDVYTGYAGTPESIKTTTFRNVWEYRQVYSGTTTVVATDTVPVGVTRTITTVTTGDQIRPMYDWRLDTRVNQIEIIVGGNRIFKYKIGGANATLNALDVSVGTPVTAEYFPFVPVRLNNVSITEPEFEDLYIESKKLYKKATGKQSFDDLLEEVEDNPDLDEIDYSYIQWAVSLNTEEKEAVRYLYTFFQGLIAIQSVPSNYLTLYQAKISAYNAAKADYDDWMDDNEGSESIYASPPNEPYLPEPETTTLKWVSDHPQLTGFDYRLSWVLVQEANIHGLSRPGAKKGDYWTKSDAPIEWSTRRGVTSPASESTREDRSNSMKMMEIYHQHETNRFMRLRVYGAVHENYIYGGKKVRINTTDALADADDSGFLIPLHMPTLKDAGLVSSTQLATANTYIVFNSYQVVKKKWYQTFFGMLFIIIVVAAAAALIAPGAVGGISGIFGTNASLGASFGLSGTAAVVVGAVTNAVTAVIISTVLQTVAVEVFGAKWGALIASILSFAISFGMAGGFNNLATLFQPNNLLAFSSALANGYQGFVAGNIAEMNIELAEIQEATQKRIEEIQKMIGEMGNDLAFNPMSLTDSAKGNGSRGGSYVPESLDEFLSRCTLSGSDIVDLTYSMITDFADLSLVLPKT
jgi:hypothetical protein